MDLHGQRIFIAGGTDGIGLALANRLGQNNRVAVGGRDAGRLQRAAQANPRLETVRLDVTSERLAGEAIDDVVGRLGGLDLLVNAAGVLVRADLADARAENALEAEVAVNVLGSMRMTRLALPHLLEAEAGAIVYFSSALALGAAPGLASYAATKAAVHSFARSLRAQLDGRIRVFDILPPFVDTDLASAFAGAKLSPDAVAAEIVTAIEKDRYEVPIGRVRPLALVARLWPRAADRIIARELGQAVDEEPSSAPA